MGKPAVAANNNKCGPLLRKHCAGTHSQSKKKTRKRKERNHAEAASLFPTLCTAVFFRAEFLLTWRRGGDLHAVFDSIRQYSSPGQYFTRIPLRCLPILLLCLGAAFVRRHGEICKTPLKSCSCCINNTDNQRKSDKKEDPLLLFTLRGPVCRIQ